MGEIGAGVWPSSMAIQVLRHLTMVSGVLKDKHAGNEQADKVRTTREAVTARFFMTEGPY